MQNMTIVDVLVALTGIIAVFVSLLTAANAAKQSAFKHLENVVDQLWIELEDAKEENKKLKKELEKKERHWERVERWAHALANQLIENHIKPVALEDIE